MNEYEMTVRRVGEQTLRIKAVNEAQAHRLLWEMYDPDDGDFETDVVEVKLLSGGAAIPLLPSGVSMWVACYGNGGNGDFLPYAHVALVQNLTFNSDGSPAYPDSVSAWGTIEQAWKAAHKAAEDGFPPEAFGKDLEDDDLENDEN